MELSSQTRHICRLLGNACDMTGPAYGKRLASCHANLPNILLRTTRRLGRLEPSCVLESSDRIPKCVDPRVSVRQVPDLLHVSAYLCRVERQHNIGSTSASPLWTGHRYLYSLITYPCCACIQLVCLFATNTDLHSS